MSKISIALATYNGEKYIREQLDSILNQTYQDFEIVVCDDCSKDSTVEILKEYAQKDERIKLYINESNLGFKKNFEKAVTLSSGEYIAFCDQDDIWEPIKLEHSINNIGENDLLCGNALLVDDSGNSLGYTMKNCCNLPKNMPLEFETRFKRIVLWNFAQGASILAKSSFLKENLPIPDDIKFHDWYFAVIAQMKNSLYYLDEILLKYRQHVEQQTQNQKDSLLKKIKPYKENKTIEESFVMGENLCSYLLTREDLPQGYKDFVTQSTLYYHYMQVNKNFFTVRFFAKNYKYFYLNNNLFVKTLMVTKRFLGVIKFKLKHKSI